MSGNATVMQDADQQTHSNREESILPIDDVQRLLSSPDGRIALHLALHRAITSLRDIAGQVIPASAPDKESFSDALTALDTATRPVAQALAWVVAWGQQGLHEQVVRSALKRLANIADQHSGFSVWVALPHWPAVLSLAAVGTAAVEYQREDLLGHVLSQVVVRRPNEEQSAVVGLSVDRAMDRDVARQFLDRPQAFTPVDDMIGERLVEWLVPDLIDSEAQTLWSFDRYQYLCGLVYWDEQASTGRLGWAPVGPFKWRREYGWTVPQAIEGELEQLGTDWPLLSAGLFGRDIGRVKAALDGYSEMIKGRVWH